MTDKRAVKVLLVDDDIDFLDLMKLQLERAGMEVETCESEAQAPSAWTGACPTWPCWTS